MAILTKLAQKIMWKLPTQWIKTPSTGNTTGKATVTCVAKVTKADGTVEYYHSRPQTED